MTQTEPTSPHTMNTYGRLPVAMSHGKGVRLWDTNGKSYLDALAGIAVNTLGHGHPKLVPALQDQVAKMMHCCNYYHIPDQEKLAAKLVSLSDLTNTFFCSTGLEANEAAIKLARKFGHNKGIKNPTIVVYEKAFHGRSIATLSATKKFSMVLDPWWKGLFAFHSTTSMHSKKPHTTTLMWWLYFLKPFKAKAVSILCGGNICARYALCVTPRIG